MINQSTIHQMALAILRVNFHNTEGHIPPYLMNDALREAQAAASVLEPVLTCSQSLRDDARAEQEKCFQSERKCYALEMKAEALVTALEDISAMSLSSADAETELRRAGSLAREAVRAYQDNRGE